MSGTVEARTQWMHQLETKGRYRAGLCAERPDHIEVRVFGAGVTVAEGLCSFKEIEKKSKR